MTTKYRLCMAQYGSESSQNSDWLIMSCVSIHIFGMFVSMCILYKIPSLFQIKVWLTVPWWWWLWFQMYNVLYIGSYKSLTHYPLSEDGCDFKYIIPSTLLLWYLLMGEWCMALQIINEHCFCYLPNARKQQAIAARNSVWGHWCHTMALGPCYFFFTEVSHWSFECHIRISELSSHIHCDHNCYITNIHAQW